MSARFVRHPLLVLGLAVLALETACTPPQPPAGDGEERMAGSAAHPGAAGATAAPAASLPVGRYVCYRLSSYGDEIAGDLHVDDADTYRSLDAEGSYRYSPSDRIVEWDSGPLHQPAEDWVGVFTAQGSSVGTDGGRADDHRIEIRRRADVTAGNMSVMQRCHFAG